MFKFIDRGFQENILLIHGWATDGRIFTKLDIPFNYIVPEETSPKEIIKAFRDGFNKMPAGGLNILGWSMGGFIAADLIAQNPEAFGKIILVSMRQSYDLEEIERVRAYLKRNTKVYLSKFYGQFFTCAKKENQQWFKNRLLKEYLTDADSLCLFDGLDYLASVRLKADFFNNPNVTFVHGENDTITAFSEAKLLISKAPEARSLFIKGAGHLPFLREEFRRRFF